LIGLRNSTLAAPYPQNHPRTKPNGEEQITQVLPAKQTSDELSLPQKRNSPSAPRDMSPDVDEHRLPRYACKANHFQIISFIIVAEH